MLFRSISDILGDPWFKLQEQKQYLIRKVGKQEILNQTEVRIKTDEAGDQFRAAALA